MKTRLGFVSNSSSSSFVLVGKEIDWSEADEHKDVYFVGDGYIEGTEVFKVTNDFKKKYKNKSFSNCSFYSTLKTTDDEEGEVYFTNEDISTLTPEYKIIPLIADEHSRYPDYIDEFEETYSITDIELNDNEDIVKVNNNENTIKLC